MESGTVVESPPQPQRSASSTSNPWSIKTPPDPGDIQVSSSPWSNISNVKVTCSLEDVMSEELAMELQNDDELKDQQRKANAPGLGVDVSTLLTDDTMPTDESDLLLAQMLQHEFDLEHDAMLDKEESKFNGRSKVSVSFSNYRSVHPSLNSHDEESSSEEEDIHIYSEKNEPKFKKGIIGKGKNITTKHDPTLCGRKNASKVMDKFPLEVDTGDGSQFDMKLPNAVYNKLKLQIVSDNKRRQRLTEKKEHSTAEHAVDPKTRLMMYKLVNAGILDQVNGVISSGKESVVFHAVGGHMEEREVPCECAIKVFKTTLNEFKNREQYYRGDFRFADEFKKQNPRKVIKIWAEKEMMNLRRMRRYGIHCPEVVICKKHMLVMSFIGQDQRPAPKLKDVQLSDEQLQHAYAQCIEAMKTLHKSCGLVHADLSEYNILWHNSHIWFIDVSQSVDFTHPKAFEFLLRDCTNIVQFFEKKGVDVMTQYELFNEITGLELKGEEPDFLAQIQQYEANEVHLAHEDNRKDYAFDYFFKRAKKEREEQKKSLKKEDVNIDDTD